MKSNVSSIRISSKRASAVLTLSRAVCYTVLGLLTVLCLFCFYFLFMNATRPHASIMSELSLVPGNYFFKNLTTLIYDTNNLHIDMFRGLLNSLIIATFNAVVTTYFSAMTAYGIHAYNFRFKKTAFAVIMIIMMVPTQVSVLGFIQLITDMGMKDTFFPFILPAVAAPIVFYFMKSYMESVLPLEIIEAARVDGSNEFRTFNRIVLPIIKPALAVQMIFAFVASWNNYFVPALLLTKDNVKTVPIWIAQIRSADWVKFDLGYVYIAIFVAIIPLMIVYIFLSRFIIRGLTLGSVKG